MLPANRSAATADFIKPQMRSAGVVSCAAYVGNQSRVTRGWTCSQV